ncbi:MULTISPECIES: PfkB family carbohydrate kinase [Lactobacillaceae]|uniref:PfkB family carbohydrate kinase n=1 Tax=Lactobacillaceae TaxID=33958 RepID=UPI0014578272|nr:PfkB family carbohydrate kinase [Lactobacillus sp. HBUAS51381]NLR10024.1 ribokinase [Lactobacillus sp. HBUAS51381]
MGRVLVIGAAYVDIVVNVQRLPRSGEDIAGEWRSTQVGGSAFNVQRALAHEGVAADLLAPVGQGEHATVVRETFHRLNLPILLTDDRADNGWDISLVEATGERTFLSVSGIERYWQADWFSRLDLSAYESVYLSGYELEDPQAAAVILTALQHHPQLRILFDASPRIGQLSPETLERLRQLNVMIHGNVDEIQQLGVPTETYQATAQRLNAETGALVVVTLDAQGCYYVDRGIGAMVPGELVQVVNTIGAGDTHCGGLLAALTAGQAVAPALQRANHLAAQVVTQSAGALGGK